ncbi:NADH dehydrogenase subunit 2 (mitochondrion) [Priapulus caudatus]|uniref:NADH-ubiquinone oxidoreductase chain 2 n=1 Tax=Priapulus caudatus TaxID=37621 RepID=A0MCU5_PRICU|nr:NADH dehydrogenase subunit 2 [Priapulus caudatus]ABE03640.1 NADH dehydrogenase subunit 2 [Priapulus caudatus]
MFILPHHILFLFILLFSMTMVACSNSWFSMWLGLEMNMLSFVTLLMTSVNMREAESGIKYFLVQVLGSIGFLFGSLSLGCSGFFFSFNEFLWTYLIFFSLLLKIGVGPFHFWFPGVMEGINMINCGMLMTWQKLGPFCILIDLQNSIMKSVLVVFAMISGLVGGLGGLNQTSLRKLLAYSSIGHLGWMLGAIFISNTIWKTYFLTYSFLSLSLILILFFMGFTHINQVFSFGWEKTTDSLMIMMMFLSLGGLPPFGGFLMKWVVFNGLVNNGLFLLSTILISSSLLNLFYYLRVCYSLSLMGSDAPLWVSMNTSTNISIWVVLSGVISIIILFSSSFILMLM